MELNQLYCGDSRELIKQLDSNSIDLIITSPPYFNLRSYGDSSLEIGREKKVEEYIEELILIFKECKRVCKETGSIVFNIGDCYLNRCLQLIPFKFAIEASKECDLLNTVTWVKKNVTPQNHKRLANSTEPFFHFVNSNKFAYYLDNVREKYSVNIGDDIGKSYFPLIEKSELTNEQKEIAYQELIEAISEAKSGKITGFRMKIKGIHSLPYGGQSGGRMGQIKKKGFFIIKFRGNKQVKDIIECATECIKGGKHPAVYPKIIVEFFVKLLTKEGDIVLDPFIGSGTTAIAANNLNRNYIGFDLSEEYIKIAKDRIDGNQ